MKIVGFHLELEFKVVILFQVQHFKQTNIQTNKQTNKQTVYLFEIHKKIIKKVQHFKVLVIIHALKKA